MGVILTIFLINFVSDNIVENAISMCVINYVENIVERKNHTTGGGGIGKWGFAFFFLSIESSLHILRYYYII